MVLLESPKPPPVSGLKVHCLTFEKNKEIWKRTEQENVVINVILKLLRKNEDELLRTVVPRRNADVQSFCGYRKRQRNLHWGYFLVSVVFGYPYYV